ncbi:MAG: hypothetical protein ABJF23_17465 [Bryobacteraceae bacterium]
MLNRYFVPVYGSNEDVVAGGSAPAAEKAERQRIYRTYLDRKLGVGDVHIYILTADGEPLDGMSVGEATVNDTNLLNMLNRVVKKLGNAPGQPVVNPGPQSVAPAAAADALVLHLSARGAARGTSYRMFPAENWIVLDKQEWMSLLPAGEAKVNDKWTVGKDVASKMLIKFYPQTVEITAGVERGRIDRQELTLTVTSLREGIVRARFDGTLHMKHGSVAQNEDFFVDAVVTGFLEFDSHTRTIRRLRLVTKKATYRDEEFLAALRSVPQAAQ